jgi:hypothetical protein
VLPIWTSLLPSCGLVCIGMDGPRLLFAGAVTVFMAGSLASFGGLGDAATSTKRSLVAVKKTLTRSSHKHALETNTPAADQYAPAKVTICHNGHTIVINRSALPGHLRNGDTSGPCPENRGRACCTQARCGTGRHHHRRRTRKHRPLSWSDRTDLAAADDNRRGPEATNEAAGTRSLAARHVSFAELALSAVGAAVSRSWSLELAPLEEYRRSQTPPFIRVRSAIRVSGRA